MSRYYFDMRQGDEIASDEEGLELPTIESVQEEAARSLADMARDGNTVLRIIQQQLADLERCSGLFQYGGKNGCRHLASLRV